MVCEEGGCVGPWYQQAMKPTHIILIDLKTDLVLYEDVGMIVGEYDMTNQSDDFKDAIGSSYFLRPTAT